MSAPQGGGAARNGPPRIVYLVHQFYPEYRNGTEKCVLQLGQAFQARGCEVQVVTYGMSRHSRVSRLWRWLGVKLRARRFSHDGLRVIALRHTGRVERHSFQVEDEAERVFALDFLRREQPDLVHVGHAMRVSGFVWAAQELGISTVFTLTDYWLLCPKITLTNSAGGLCAGPRGGSVCRRDCAELDGDAVARRLGLTESLVRKAGAVVAPSEHLARVFHEEWPWLEPRHIPYGILPLASNQRVYDAGSAITFAYAGSLNRHKGVHLLIEAFAGVRSDSARLRIHGSGPDEASLRTLAGADPRVTFCGSYDERTAAQVFGTMDVLAAPSLWSENRPFVVHEAMASGVPTVTTDVSGLGEAVRPGVTGWVVPPGDRAALSAVLQAIVDDPARLNAAKAALADLRMATPEMEADEYQVIYEQLLGRKIRAAR